MITIIIIRRSTSSTIGDTLIGSEDACDWKGVLFWKRYKTLPKQDKRWGKQIQSITAPGTQKQKFARPSDWS